MSRFNQIGNQKDFLIIHPNQLQLLFPHREATIAQISNDTYQLLFKALICSICGQFLQPPVLLKCSHRFCRACIERRIRSSTKKSCPTCLTPLLTKRQLRPDDFAMDFIDAIFGNIPIKRQVKAEQDEHDEIEIVLPEQKNKIFKTKVHSRSRPQDLQHDIDGSMPAKRKRKMEFLGDQQIKLDLNQSFQSIPDDQTKIEDVQNDSMATDDAYETITEGSIKIQNRTINSKNHQSIDQFNNFASDEKNQQTGQDEFDKDNLDANQTNGNLPSQIPATPLNPPSQKQAKLIKIRLMAHPEKYTTPFLTFSHIQCSSIARTKCLFDLLSYQFNLLKGEYVQLYVKFDDLFRRINQYETLLGLNDQYWKNDNEKTYLNSQARMDNPQTTMPPHGLIYFSIENKLHASLFS